MRLIKVLDRYVVSQFLGAFLGSLLIFVLMQDIIDLMDRVEFFTKHSATWQQILFFYLTKSPFFLVQYAPVAALFAVVYSLGNMVRYKEMDAIFSAGIKFFRITLPVYITGIIISFSLILFEEFVVSVTQQRHHKLYREIKKFSQSTDRSFFALYGKEGYLYHVNFFAAKLKHLKGVQIIKRKKGSNEPLFRIDARMALWDNKKKMWKFLDGTIRYFDKKGEVNKIEEFKEKYIHIPDKPKDFEFKKENVLDLKISEALAYIEKLKRNGMPFFAPLVDFHLKFSFPFTVVIILFFGAPFCFFSKRSVLVLSLGYAILCGVIFWIVLNVGVSFGKNGAIPPVLAAWSGNIIFSIGAYFIHSKLRV